MINDNTKITKTIHHQVKWWADGEYVPRNMAYPKRFKSELKKAIADAKRTRGSRWRVLHFWRDWHGKPMEVMYAMRLFELDPKANTARCETQLIYAGIPCGPKWVVGNLVFSYLAGYIVQWHDACRGYYTYRPCCDYTMTPAYDKEFHPSFGSHDVYCTKYSEFMDLKTLPKGFVMSRGDSEDPYPFEWMQYLVRWQRSKFVEPLVKMGFTHMWNDGSIDRLKNRKKISATIAYMKREKRDICGMHVHYPIIRKAMNAGLGIKKYFEEELIKDYQRVLERFDFDRPLIKEIVKYINGPQKGGLTHYADYLDASVKLGRNINDRGVLFPADFCKQFDMMQAAIADITQAETNKKISEMVARFADQKEVVMNNGLRIVIPETYGELVNLGNALHNCVGTCGYGEMMADGSILILAVYKDGEPVGCAEVALPENENNSARKKHSTMAVVQLRGDHNSLVDKDVEKAVRRYMTGIRKVYKRAQA